MDSKEIVRRTLDYEGPERVAHTFGEPDMIGVECTPKTHASEWKELEPGHWERVDEWGNVWQRLDRTSKG